MAHPSEYDREECNLRVRAVNSTAVTAQTLIPLRANTLRLRSRPLAAPPFGHIP
jgi:hypothetical protein